MVSLIILYLLLLISYTTLGSYPVKCPDKPHWNFRAKSLCNNVEDYRCLWDANNHQFIEQCSEFDIQRKGFRKVIEGDITAGDCTANTYQPRKWTTKGNFDCEFQKSLCNDIGQLIYEDGGGITDRTCGCNHTAGYAFLTPPKNPCYCVPSEEDCTCIKKRCDRYQRVDPEYKCRSIFSWKSWFSCPIVPCGSIKEACKGNKIGSTTVSPIVISFHETTENTIPNKVILLIVFVILLVVFTGTGVIFLYKDSLFKRRLGPVFVYEGETAIFSCEVVDEKMIVSWFVNGEKIHPDDSRYQVFTDRYCQELLINDVKRSENEMKINAMVGYEESSATLLVKESYFVIKITSQTVKIGDTAIFRCELRDDNDTVQWFINGDEIGSNRQYTICQEGKYHEIKINRCTLEYDKMIVAVANTYKEKRTAQLFVIDSAFAKELRPAIVYEGETARFSCEVVGEEMEVIWTVNNEPITTRNRFEMKSYGCIRELMIYNVQESENDMNITAMVNNEISTATLGVKASYFTTKITNTMAKKGDPAVFSCAVRDAIDTVQWFVNSKPIGSNDMYMESKAGKKCELRINQCTLKDDKIVVSVVNRDGEKRTAKLFVVENDNIPLHIQEQFKKRSDYWVTEDDMYVRTQAAEDVMAKIKEHTFVVVTGNSGTGKTFTIRHTALIMEKEGYIIVPAVDPEDINKYYKHGCKTVFVFDDLCGRFTFNQNHLDQWKFNQMSLVEKMKDCSCKIIASCRLQVVNDESMRKFISDIGGSECKITTSVNEKKTIVKKYFGTKAITIAESKLLEFDFVPFLCSNLRNNHSADLEKCFTNPFTFFTDQLKNLFQENDDGKGKCCALVLCILYNNTLTWRELSKTPEIANLVLKECALSSSESLNRIKASLESLFGVYITNDDGTYKILHDKLFDYMAKYFGEKLTKFFIKFADSDFFRERFLIETRQTSDTNDFIKIADDDTIKLFMDRMVCDWKRGEVNRIFCNTNLNNESFRRQFLSYLKGLDEPSQRELVHKRDNDRGDTPLFMISFYGDVEFARWVLALGADVNLGRTNNSTPLHIACQKGFIDLVEILLECEQINDDNRGTALRWAYQGGRFDIVQLLMECEQNDINYSDKNGSTALHWACQEEYTDLVQLLLKCEYIDVNRSNNDGNTALHFACEKGNVGIVLDLIQYKADMNRCNINGFTPLMLACVNNNLEVVRVLLTRKQIDVDRRTNDGQTALHMACKHWNAEIVSELIQKNIDINQRIKVNDGWTPLMLACLFDQLEVVTILLKCEQINVNQSNNDGKTALHLACEKGNERIVLELLTGNADINRCSNNGFTPLMLACKHKHLNLVKLLLQCEQIDVNYCTNHGQTALHVVCQEGNVDIVTELLQRKVNINQSKNDGWTPLMLACKNNHLEIVKVLLKIEQTDVNHSADDGSTAFHVACQRGNGQIVIELIQNKVNINQITRKGYTPLMLACYNNHLEVVKALLKCEQIDVNRSAENGTTAFHVACQKGNAKMVTELIERKVDINKSAKNGQSSLMLACYNNDLNIVEVLLKCEQIDVNHCANDGRTALHVACMEGNEKIVIMLIQRNANMNIGDEKGLTPLMSACENSHLEVVKVLLRCEQIDVSHSDKDGQTALHVASMEGNAEIVTELIQRNTNINRGDKVDWTPLMLALKYNHLQVVEVLLECKHINVGHTAEDGQTALHVACMEGNADIVAELIQHNANINKGDKDDWTPLMLASMYNNIQVFNVLLKYGQIDLNHSAKDGETALHVACKMGHVEIVIELIKHNPDINSGKDDGWTALMLACYNNYPDIVKVLLKCEQIEVNHNANDGQTALHVACEKGNVEIVTELLDCKLIDVNHLDNNGRTAFYRACHNGPLELVRKLITCGVDINYSVVDTTGQLECDHENKGKLEQFLGDGVKDVKPSDGSDRTLDFYTCQLVHSKVVLDIARCPRPIYACRKDGWFPLLEACDENQVEIVRELLKCPDIKLNQCNSCGQTALYWACLKSHNGVIAELIKSGVDANISDINNISPLHIARMAKNEVAVIMIEPQERKPT